MNALVFPGQGSQKIGMARVMVETHPWAAAMARRADEILGHSISSVCFTGPEESLKKTINTQPALFLTEAILTEALRRQQIPFQAVAGHSLGEYSALYAAGVADFEDLLRLVQTRARAMETACPTGEGAMAAILMLDRQKIAAICQEVAPIGVCVMANLNAPGQVVISGAAAAVTKAGELAKAQGAKRVVMLEVSGPFHSPLMTKARTELEQAIRDITFRTATVPVYTNVDAAPTTDANQIKNKLLEQLTGTVRWEDAIQAMFAAGFRRFIEVGPGKVLCGLIKKIAPEAETAQFEDPTTLAAIQTPASAAAQA
ncbi:MAG TPA: ACP S-malonyltransferase [Candidatus Ozemobacteraceae bacterium]|nr:ACP S-malonyltransferase [Candidatus Ozemobacteraceae bacterium]